MTAEKLQFIDGQPQATTHPILLYIEGDGIGPDIWRATQKVVDQAVAIVYQGERQIAWREILAGEKAYQLTGSWLPEATIAAINDYQVALKGPLTTPIGEGFRSLNVTLRQTFDLFTCLRPVRYFKGVPSPVKEPEKTDMVIFRENTEDIYAGIEFAAGSPEGQKLIQLLQTEFAVTGIRFPETSSIGIKPISQTGSERLIRAAIDYALLEGRPSVTLVHKGNIMKFTEGGFKKWGYQLARREYANQTFTLEEYQEIKEVEGSEAADKAWQLAISEGKLLIKDRIADIFLQEALIKPEAFDVVATMNLNGDYISDALAAQVGGIGIAPGANINQETGAAIFEATHGTAPEFAGTDRLNPSSLILSAAMMLRYIGWSEVANQIEQALEATILQKKVTEDFADYLENATKLSGSQFADALLNNLSGSEKVETKR